MRPDNRATSSNQFHKLRVRRESGQQVRPSCFQPWLKNSVWRIAKPDQYNLGRRVHAPGQIHKVCVFGQQYRARLKGIGCDIFVLGVTQSDVAHVFGIVALCLKPDNKLWRQILVDQKAISRFSYGPTSACVDQANDGMIRLRGGEGVASVKVFGLKVRVVLKDLRAGCATGQHVEHVLNPYPHAADARPSATLARIERDARLPIHATL